MSNVVDQLLSMIVGSGTLNGRYFDGKELQEYNAYEEYELIKQKKSKLSANKRRRIISFVEQGRGLNHE